MRALAVKVVELPSCNARLARRFRAISYELATSLELAHSICDLAAVCTR